MFSVAIFPGDQSEPALPGLAAEILGQLGCGALHRVSVGLGVVIKRPGSDTTDRFVSLHLQQSRAMATVSAPATASAGVADVFVSGSRRRSIRSPVEFGGSFLQRTRANSSRNCRDTPAPTGSRSATFNYGKSAATAALTPRFPRSKKSGAVGAVARTETLPLNFRVCVKQFTLIPAVRHHLTVISRSKRPGTADECMDADPPSLDQKSRGGSVVRSRGARTS